MPIFSAAQCVGYVAFVLGIAAFLQKNDMRLKFLNGCESLTYFVHFLLLGNFSAASSGCISGIRSFVTMKTSSRLFAAFFVALNIGFGIYLSTSWYGYLPVIGSCVATVALFTMKGIPMRLAMLLSTLLWLTNNLFSGSIGGTALETLIAIANTFTIIRLFRGSKSKGSVNSSRDAVLEASCSRE